MINKGKLFLIYKVITFLSICFFISSIVFAKNPGLPSSQLPDNLDKSLLQRQHVLMENNAEWCNANKSLDVNSIKYAKTELQAGNRYADDDFGNITATNSFSISNSLNRNPPSATPVTSVARSTEIISEQDKATLLLKNNNWFFIIPGFFIFGLLLAFTPCVLPMVPILVSIIAGQGKSLTTRKAFGLSLTYVLAMSFTYASAGVLAGYAGSYVQAFFQNEWVITIFSLIFILLALSLFGFYELQIPHSWQHKITEYSNKQIGGTYLGVAIMGFLATLIVSPCVTAPLVGVLSYIGNTGNMLVGGVALFVMGLGMGLPLIIVGIGGGKLLPKSGSWLNVIKVIVGILLLGVAIWMLSRIVSDQTTIVLISILVIGSSIYSGRLSLKYHGIANKLLQVTSIILFLYGLALFIGVLMGNISLLQPLKMKQVTATQNQTDIKISFYYVKNVNDLQAQLMNAKNMHKPVFLDFYADWCVSCKMMDRYVLTDQKVKELLQSFVLLRADMTANTADDIALAKHFKMIGPPVVIFFDANGKQIQPAIVGEVATKELIKRSEQVLQNHN
jgi:thiol:disulfide interchange protein DsbD